MINIIGGKSSTKLIRWLNQLKTIGIKLFIKENHTEYIINIGELSILVLYIYIYIQYRLYIIKYK